MVPSRVDLRNALAQARGARLGTEERPGLVEQPSGGTASSRLGEGNLLLLAALKAGESIMATGSQEGTQALVKGLSEMLGRAADGSVILHTPSALDAVDKALTGGGCVDFVEGKTPRAALVRLVAALSVNLPPAAVSMAVREAFPLVAVVGDEANVTAVYQVVDRADGTLDLAELLRTGPGGVTYTGHLSGGLAARLRPVPMELLSDEARRGDGTPDDLLLEMPEA